MSPITKLTKQVQTAITDRDKSAFQTAHFDITGFLRKFIIEADKPILQEAENALSNFLAWFYHTGEPEWSEILKQIGELEGCLNLIQDRLGIFTHSETLLEIKKSQRDQFILSSLIHYPNGMLSGELAKSLDIKPNTLTNRFPSLERMGVLRRMRKGKNSLVFLTPLGQKLAWELQAQPSQPVKGKEFTHPTGIKTPAETPTMFWNIHTVH